MKIQYPTKGYITQFFDTPVNYIIGRFFHEALDVVTLTFEKIVSMFSGTVDEVIDDVENYAYGSATNLTGYGNEVWIESDNARVLDRFCHNKKGSPVREGQYVNPGDQVATTGQTGYRVPDEIIHTHFERYIDGIRVDPLDTKLLKKALEKKSLTIDDMSSLEEIARNQEVILKTLKEHTKQIARLQTRGKRLKGTVLPLLDWANQKGAAITTKLKRKKKKKGKK